MFENNDFDRLIDLDVEKKSKFCFLRDVTLDINLCRSKRRVHKI